MKTLTLVALLTIAAMITSARTLAQSGATSISTSFTPADIPAGRQVWFAASLKVTGTVTYPVTIYFHHQTISCSAFSLSVPDGELILDPIYTHATTLFNGSKWVTTSPPDEPGNYFIAAGQYSSSLVVPGGQNPVTWSGTFTASRPGVSLDWKWWCASYYAFVGPIYEDGAKASDCFSCTQWAGNAHAGTPQYVDHVHDLSGLNEFTGGGTGYSYTDSVGVTCGEAILATVAISASATSVCTGDSITFTASPVNGGLVPSYQWKIDGVNVGSNSPTYTLSSPVTGEQISVDLTSSDPLVSSSTALSNTITISVNSAPAHVAITGVAAVCMGGISSLNASSGGGVWSSGNTAISTVSNSGIITGVAAGTAILSYALSNSCGTTVAIKAITVSNTFSLSGTLTSPTCNGYTNGSVVISAVPRRGHTYTYAWSDGSTSFGRWGVPAGTYSVSVTNEAGCAATATYTVTQPAALASTNSITDVYPYGGTNGAIYYGVSGGTWPYTYSWSNGATSQNITGLTPGSYVVTVTDANSCTLTNWFGVRGPYCLGGKAASNAAAGTSTPGAEFSAFPNPFSSETRITFSAPNNGNTIVDVYSLSGEKIASIFNEDTRAGQEYSCKLSGEQLASGVYLYKIVSADRAAYTGRIVLVK
jgi:hypothetical protein